ncbi:MAG: DUF2779 domain-containing protein [Acidobacteria bacterium]|nr:MAG: DUF2779 domain-containing protein [Acidobacteriota bacterium]
MSQPRYLTKSRFKLALECPTKLFYTNKDEYANQKIDDPFLLALAKGGFQVGELAKSYFPGGEEVTKTGYDEPLARTNELLKRENVTIFEAAIKYENFFIRVDVLVKKGNHLELIEVKSKSYKEGETEFYGKRGGMDSNWTPHLYDVAFQKYVVTKAFPDSSVSASLMLTDRGSVCPTDGLNQKFRIRADGDRRHCELIGELTPEETENQILVKVNVDAACDDIFAGTDTKVPSNGLAAIADHYAELYAKDEREWTPVSRQCRTCEYRTTPDEDAEGKLSGRRECWQHHLGWTAAECDEPTVFDIWNYHFTHTDKRINERRLKFSELIEADFDIKPDEIGIHATRRRWLQVQMAVRGDGRPHIELDGLRAEMKKWKFPLHFIDFETSTPAIPFTRGRRPYGEVAFQFSHHIVREDGTVEHAGEHLEERRLTFPNYDFLRKLREELSKDEGTIFRYASHENSYLNAIYRQLSEETEDIPDREELNAFIKSISKSTKDNVEQWEGERNMVDMLELVKRYYIHPMMKKSNSIKFVLPAVLNSSTFLQQKYSQPIVSRNYPEGKIWAERDGELYKDPYHLLPEVFGIELIDRLSEEEDDKLKDGGAAMMAYARLQFEDMSEEERQEIISALKRYCELDTLAMVMIYEAWKAEV